MMTRRLSLPHAIHTAASGLAGALLIVATPALAASGQRSALEEVVVTAQKQDEMLQTVPLAISAYDANALEAMKFTNLNDLSMKQPALTIAPFPTNNSTLTIFMRGVGTTDADQVSRDAGVGIYVDDVYLGRAQGSAADIADIERIEILRGPQGTLYGRNTIGGAIKYITAKPTGSFGLKQSLTAGNYDYFQSITNLNLPEIYGVRTKLSYLSEKRDGLVHNPGEARDFGVVDKRGYRVALQAQPAPTVTIDYAYDRSENNGTSNYMQQGSVNQFTPFYKTPIFHHRLSTAFRGVDLPIRDDFKIDGHTLTVAWDASDALTIKSITAYRQTQNDRLHDAVDAFNFPLLNSGNTHQSQVSQEFVLNGSSDQLDYVAGVYYFREKANQKSRLAASGSLAVNPPSAISVFRPPTLSDLPAFTIADVVNRSEAVYGQVTWNPEFWDQRWSFAVGARYSRDYREQERSLGATPIDSGDTDYSSFDPSFTIDFKWTDAIHTYVKRAKAYRSGGFNIRTLAHEPYGPEKLVSYEVGLKSMWLDDRVRFNIDAYKSDYKDIQLDFTDPATLLPHTVNAGEATVKGIEAELAVIPFAGLQIRLDYGYMDATLDKGGVNPFSGQPLIGLSMPQTPRNKYNVDVDYTFEPFSFGELSADINYAWTDQYTTNGGPGSINFPVDSYGVLNARMTLAHIGGSTPERGDLSLSLWSKNLLDKEYVVYRLNGGDMYGEPRTFGLTLAYKY